MWTFWKALITSWLHVSIKNQHLVGNVSVKSEHTNFCSEQLTIYNPVTLGHFNVNQLLKPTKQNKSGLNISLTCVSPQLHPHLTINHVSSIVQSQQPHGQSPNPDHRRQGGDVAETGPGRWVGHCVSVLLVTERWGKQPLYNLLKHQVNAGKIQTVQISTVSHWLKIVGKKSTILEM